MQWRPINRLHRSLMLAESRQRLRHVIVIDMGMSRLPNHKLVIITA